MKNERWLSLEHRLPDGSEIGRLLHGGCDWQIYRLDNQKLMLVVKSTLAHRWVELKILPDTVWASFSFGQENYRFITSDLHHRLEPIALNRAPDNKADALSFALSLRETRKIDGDMPLHDAIYLERYSRLLPTWPPSKGGTDEEILGQWLTGGVAIPATSFRCLSSFLGWLSKRDLADLLLAAGLNVPQDLDVAETRQGQQPLSDSEAGSKSSTHSQPSFRLPGRTALEVFFNEHVIDVVENPERYRALGIDFPAAVVLHGPPGCGKTFAVEKLGAHLDWPVFPINTNVASPYHHETSRKIGEVFDQAMDVSPSLVVIDEMESYLCDRQLHGSIGLHHVEEVGEFLRRIPEAAKRQVLVIGMTNRLDMIDSAILRRGRFDHLIEVGMPSVAEVAELMDALLARVPTQGEMDTGAVVKSLAGRALSDTAFVVREAARLTARAGRRAVDDESLWQALASLQTTAATASIR